MKKSVLILVCLLTLQFSYAQCTKHSEYEEIEEACCFEKSHCHTEVLEFVNPIGIMGDIVYTKSYVDESRGFPTEV